MPKPTVVPDTNILVSSLLAPRGLESSVLDLGFRRQIQLCISREILEEYETVLSRPKFHLDPAMLSAFLLELRKSSLLFAPQRSVLAASDPDDNKFIECAEAAHADFLVTGNRRHFRRRCKSTRIVNAGELMHDLFP